MLTPEQIVRQKIDRLLASAGWELQDPSEFNRNAALGVAVREFQLTTGPCDYLLFVAGKAAGVVEAKKAGIHPQRRCRPIREVYGWPARALGEVG